MKIKKTAALVIAFLVLTQNVAFAASSNNPPPSSLFTNSWEKTSKSDFYQFTCKKSIGTVKAGSNLSDAGQATVDILKAASRVYREILDGVYMGKDKKVKGVMEKRDVFDKIGNATTADEVQQALRSTGKKMMTFLTSGDSIYYKSNGFEGEESTWKTFIDASTASRFLEGAGKTPPSSPFNKNSFAFSKWKSSGKVRSAIYDGLMTSDDTHSLVRFYVGEGTGFTTDLAKVKLTIDERTGNWVRSDSVATVHSSDPAYEIQIKQACTYNFKSKVRVVVPKGAKEVEPATGNLELFGLSSAF